MRKYVRGVEEVIGENRIEDIIGINRTIKEIADKELRKSYSRKVGEKVGNREPPWVTEEVRKEIGERKRINRLRRNMRDTETREQYWEMYRAQKEKVKGIVRREMLKYEDIRTE